MALQGQSHIKITADVNDAKTKLQQMQAQLKNTGKTAEDVSSSIQGAFQKIGSAMAVGLSVAGLQQFTNQLIQTRGQFQQLEIAFGTMLGSTEKADALMKQLIQTAAKTPFDMQGIAQGAKQLLAYGTAAEDVNDTIVKLGDIAAGLSLPLNDLVYLYGTTMAQGRMFTMDLRQMQGRGIPIADEIAKIMNVSKEAVPEMVTAGKVTSEIFSQAIKNMSSEGGKFYNLMEKQSSSLTGQISNLEDAIDQMFNEIGKGSEDLLSSGISAVSYVVEHYKEFATVLGGLITTYGAYKASVIAVYAINQAKMLADNIRLVAMFRKELGLLKAAQQAFNITAMANPYVLLGSAIAGVVATLIGFTIANNGASASQKKLNEAIDESNQKFAELENTSKNHLNTIRDENSSNQAKIDAYNELKKLVPDLTDKYSLEELQVIALTTANKELLGVLEQVNIQSRKNRLEQLQQAKSQFNAQGVNENLLPKEYRDDFNMWQNNETQMNILNGLIDAETKGIRELERANLSLDEKLSASQKDLIDAQNKTLDAKEKLDRANAEKITGQTSKYQETDILARRQKAQEEYNKALEREKELNEEVNALQTQKNNIVYQNLTEEQNKALKAVQESEKKLQDLRSGKAKSKDYKTDIETETKNLQELIKTYETLSGKKYKTIIVDPQEREKQLEELKKFQQKSADEEYAYEKRLIQDKYELIRKEEEKQLQAIDREEKEYNKKNGSTQSSRDAFNARRKTVRLNAQFDLEQLDKEFKQWKDDFERENEAIQFNIEVAGLQQELSLTDDINEKLKIQKEIRQKLFNQKLKEIELEKQNAIKEKFGEQELNKYLAGTSTNENVASLAKSYDARKYWTGKEMMFSNSAEQLTEELDRWEQFAQGVIEIETERAETIKSIQKGESHTNMANVNAWLNTKKANLMEELGITDFPEQLNSIIALTTATSIEGLQTQMAVVKEEIDRLKLEGETELSIAQANNDTEGIEKANKKIALATKLGEKATKVFDKQGDKLSTTNAKWEKVSKQMSETAMIISDVTNLIGSLEEAFGDLLSDGAKDAIQTMQTISGVATGLIQNQQLVALAAGESISAVEKASVILAIISAAVQVISAITKVILNNFSEQALLDRRINHYNNIIDDLLDKQAMFEKTFEDSEGIEYWQNLSLSAQTYGESLVTSEENLSRYLSNVEIKLKHAKDELNRLKSAQGSGFISEAKIENAEEEVKELEEILESSGYRVAEKYAQKAVEQTKEYYDKMKSKWGEDSEKAQNAKEDWESARDVLDDIQQQSAEQAKEVFEHYATTNLTSFGETMASAMVNAFSQGLDGMNKAFDNTIDDMIKSMLEQRMADKMMEILKPAFDYLEDVTKVEQKIVRNGRGFELITEGDAIINDEEMSTFIEMISSAKEGAISLSEEYQKLFAEMGLLDDTIDAESKGFQAMSQDTADELNGRFTALQISGAGIQMSAQGMATSVEDIARINMGIQGGVTELANNSSVALQIAQNQLNELRIISENTAMLTETNSRLKQIQDNTARL